MPIRNHARPFQDKAYKQLVHFRNGEVVAFMAVYRMVFALLPRHESGLHEMTAHTKIRVVLRKVIKPIGNETAADQND